jgi:hypothetical protein
MSLLQVKDWSGHFVTDILLGGQQRWCEGSNTDKAIGGNNEIDACNHDFTDSFLCIYRCNVVL